MIKKYSKEKQQEVITARKHGATLKEISSRTSVSVTTIKKWLSDSAQQGVAGIRIRRYFSTANWRPFLLKLENSPKLKTVAS